MRETAPALLLASILVGSILLASPCAAAELNETEYIEAIEAILCDCGCHPQSVKDCACGRAAEMRDEIATLIRGDDGSGPRTGQQVIDLYVERGGEQVLVSPKARGFNLLAWLGPFVVLFLALVGITWLARHWSRQRAAEPLPAGGPATVDTDDPYVTRVQREVQELE